MDYCPFSGLPCPHDKCYKITDVEKNKATQTNYLCNKCGIPYVEALFNPQKDSVTVAKEEIPIEKSEPLKPTTPVVITNAIDLIEVLLGHGVRVEKPPEKAPCPRCNLSLSEFNREGRFGCAVCYDHFMDEFLALAGPFQEGEDQHVGKIPKGFREGKSSKEERLKVLRLRFAHAVETEKYENAAVLKKEIDALVEGNVCSHQSESVESSSPTDPTE